jgi:hypothetical protein
MTTNVLNLPGNYKIVSSGTFGTVTVSGNIVLGTTTTNTISVPARFISSLIPKTSSTYNLGTATNSWNFIYNEQQRILSKNNVGNKYNRPYDPGDMYDTPEHRNTASLYVAGGVGIEKDLNVGGFIYGRIETANTSLSVVVTATNIDIDYYPTFVLDTSSYQIVFVDKDGIGKGLRYNPFFGKLKTDRVLVVETDISTGTSSGALVVNGGVGIAGTMTIGGDILPSVDLEQQLGNTGTQWAEAYVHDIYTRLITSTTGTIEIKPEAGLTDVFGDIRVRGTNPIGTAPVVTNTLYVTVDGNDTNDGRAMDASRACRTIGAALNSPYYQPGTQILVSAGFYLEDNPLRMKPYTSVRGSDIRTTFIEPINKTQDLFHVDSGCYLNYMTFLNGRSGLLEGQYAQGFNRGAYATAFPPLTGSDRIDLFHSPYIQNCTNQSGPWLKDGTMFIPSQTVQVPAAVGTGTWIANTTTIVVSTSLGTIVNGMSINAGEQNPGFFNARTLLLASKPFLQEQVVKYINKQIQDNASTPASIWFNFIYNREKCRRDVGILIENVSYDATFGGNQKAVESGLSYYNGVVSLIAGQELQTTSAIDYLKDRCLEVITNTTCTNTLSGGLFLQVRNTVLLGGGISRDSITSLFGIINTIINNGPSAAPEIYKSTGPDAAYVSAEILMQANRKFIQQDTISYINNVIYANSFPYSKIKCRRDTRLIVDSIALDLLYNGLTQSNFAGIQYWNKSGYTGAIARELNTTTGAIRYLKELSVKIIKNITPTDDLVNRFFTPTVNQDTSIEPATDSEVVIINPLFDTIIDIINKVNTTWTDSVIPNGDDSRLLSVQHAVTSLQNNKIYLQNEVNAYIQASVISGGLGYSATNYDVNRCKTDIGLIIDCICFDLLHGGNRQSIQAGVYYLGVNSGSSTIHDQEVQTQNAFSYLSTIAQQIIQNIRVNALQIKVKQNVSLTAATSAEATALNTKVLKINSIITNVSNASAGTAISLIKSSDINVINAYKNILANKAFIVEEVIAYIDQTYNPGKFSYDEESCYRDTGLIVDAVSQDILLGGNKKSIEAGLAYWSAGYNYIAGQETTTTNAINHARDIALKIIANTTVTPQTGTTAVQVINPFFQYGGDYMPQQAVTRNFGIITDLIQRGPLYAPISYAGGGLFALTGLNGSDVKISPTVTSVSRISGNKYLIGLSSPTIGFGTNATLYFGEILIYPKRDSEVEALSLEYTGKASTWNSRKVDAIGSMGGSLVDGAVISNRSPIQSFVYDAFTQVNQGGRGVHITNDGYAQLVSVFTIFCSIGVQTDNGGIASIVNSNANFGDICLLSSGYGSRKFTGTIYNPAFKAYPDDPEVNIYYPNGYWPSNARVQVFLPDLDDRPHISLVMEIVPPETFKDYTNGIVPYTNDQGFPGFLNAAPNTGTLTTSSITITGIDTTGIAIGNSLYIRDQNASQTGTNGLLYAASGTVVTALGYQSVTLNYALTSGGSDPFNSLNNYNNNYFDLYFCGNAYYTVLSSEVSTNPKPSGINILTTASTGGTISQVPAHIRALEFLNTLTNKIVSNQLIERLQTSGPSGNNKGVPTYQTTATLVARGGLATTFIDLRFEEMKNIIDPSRIGQPFTLAAAEAVIKPSQRTKSGPIVQGGGDAITLIKANIEFLADEINARVKINNPALVTDRYDEFKCQRDIKIILQRLIYDIETGGRYNSVLSGLSYWSRDGAHHLVQLGENVTRTDLFPDGSTVNFYQRSYISASGYVFEYVGAGTNYGALPQRGVADPVQGKEVVQLDSGKVFFTSTDQNGDFRIGPGLVISQATGVLSGRTFTKSLFANMTPFILAIEGGGMM